MTKSCPGWYWHFGLASSLALLGASTSSGDCALAQITPDGTLPNNSIVTSQGNTRGISGGTQKGSNLFHSFEQFSVPTGGEAFFNNAADIQNIISRVTGESISNIDGLIRANGTANLFLLNAKGIIFGPNAELNIGGSFLGSTASSLNFADGNSFSATTPQATPLLTISVPIGLQIAQNPGAIRVQGTGHSLTLLDPIFSPFTRGSSLTGLRVQPGNTLALVGGDVALESSTLTAEQGRIELGSVGDGQVSLSPTTSGWTLGYEGVQSFQDIRLSQKALVDASGSGGGSIQVQGQRLEVRDGSVILIQNQGSQAGGAIFVHAAEFVEVSGFSADATINSELINETVGVGNAGDITVSTPRLLIQDWGQISAATYSAATGGNITVNAGDSVQLIGSSVNRPNFSGISAATHSSGRAGDITVSTRRLAVRDGGVASSLTRGTGDGGDVIVNATDSVELIGVLPILSSASALAATTFAAGDAGSLTINTSKLAVRDGGRVDASTFASGAAGSVTINAKESVEVRGTVPGLRNPSLVTSSAIIQDEAFRQAAGLPPKPSGTSGDVTINTPALSVTNAAQVSVRNDGSGNAGTLRVNANSIILDNLGGITAATAFGGGGNIVLHSGNLLARDDSAITATAGGGGNGGNISIDTGTLVALENSDITANAFLGQGGWVEIKTQGIFGTEARIQQTPQTSDITASSTGGPDLSGTVEINTPDVDLSRGLTTLPAELVDVSGLIAPGCPGSRGNLGRGVSEFIITGRGGLPPSPSDALRSDAVRVDLGRPIQGGENRASAAPSTNPTSPAPTQLVEAQGWVINNKGEVVLTARPSSVTPHSSWLTAADCHMNQTSS